MTTIIPNLPKGTVSTDVWFDSSVANGSFPENRDYATFNFGEAAIQNCIGFQFIGCTLSSSYYIFDATNNEFIITVTDSGTKVYKVDITPGTYDSVNFPTQFETDVLSNTTVVSGGGGATDLSAVYAFKCLVDASTSQLLIYQNLSSAAGKPFTITFPSTINSAQEQLGFQGALTTSVFSSSVASTLDNSNLVINGAAVHRLYSPYMVQFSGPNYLILHSSLFNSCTNTPTIFPNQQTSDQLKVVEVNANYQGTITAGPDDKINLINSTVPIGEATFYFTLGTRTLFSNYSLSGAVATRNYVSFNGAPFLIGIRFFELGKSLNSMSSDMQSGDKMQEAHPMYDGSKSQMYGNNSIPRPIQAYAQNKYKKRKK